MGLLQEQPFFGTITTGDAQGEMLLVMMSALSRVSISFFTHSACCNGNVYGLCAIGGLSPVSISISIRRVLPMSPLPLDIMSSYSLQRLLNLSLVSCVQDWSCRSTFLWEFTSAGDLMKLVLEASS